MPLDFESAARLFMGTEEELARALDVSVGDVRALRTTPRNASPQLMARLSAVLVERGRGMVRVGEMLREEQS